MLLQQSVNANRQFYDYQGGKHPSCISRTSPTSLFAGPAEISNAACIKAECRPVGRAADDGSGKPPTRIWGGFR